MTANELLRKAQIRAALAELNELALAEYGTPLEALLLSRDPISELHVQRLVGVATKSKVAKPKSRPAHSATDAGRSWPYRSHSRRGSTSSRCRRCGREHAARRPA